MKKIVVNPNIAVGLVFFISFTQAMAQSRPALINPGTELAPVDNMPKTGIAHTPFLSNDKQQTNQQAVGQASVSGLSYILRCPANDANNPDCNDYRQWKLLESSTAYYRDPIIAALTPIINATDGETWSVSFIKPEGGQINIGPVSFSSNGNCFNLTNYTVCGSNDINIYWYFNGQCTQTRDWRVEAKHNGNLLGTLDFSVRPQLGTPAEVAAKLPSYAQMLYPQAYANICHDPDVENIYSCRLNKGGQIPWTIADYGCTTTSFASVLSYFGATIDPPALNQWLIDNNGYDKNGDFPNLRIFEKYAKTRNIEVSIAGGNSDPNSLNRNICTYGPAPIRSDNDAHTVTAIGRDDALTTVSILDAYDGATKELTDARYNNQFSEQYIVSGPEHHFSDDHSGLNFAFHSPVEAFVIDPLNRRQGIDPRSNSSYNEIPKSFYGTRSTIGPKRPLGYEPPKVLDIDEPIEGVYTLTVVGIDVGTYDGDFEAYDVDLNSSKVSVTDIPTAPNLVNIYQINFTKTVGSKIQLGGGFDGGGQRPKDVNRFLSYANPGTNRTTSPTTAANYPLLLFYGASIMPASFNAQLNGADITALFHPAQGTGDKVLLNLQPGRNLLVLSVDGDVGGRVATDTDRLVFDLQ